MVKITGDQLLTTCPKCGSNNIKIVKTKEDKSTTLVDEIICRQCGNAWIYRRASKEYLEQLTRQDKEKEKEGCYKLIQDQIDTYINILVDRIHKTVSKVKARNLHNYNSTYTSHSAYAPEGLKRLYDDIVGNVKIMESYKQLYSDWLLGLNKIFGEYMKLNDDRLVKMFSKFANGNCETQLPPNSLAEYKCGYCDTPLEGFVIRPEYWLNSSPHAWSRNLIDKLKCLEKIDSNPRDFLEKMKKILNSLKIKISNI